MSILALAKSIANEMRETRQEEEQKKKTLSEIMDKTIGDLTKQVREVLEKDFVVTEICSTRPHTRTLCIILPTDINKIYTFCVHIGYKKLNRQFDERYWQTRLIIEWEPKNVEDRRNTFVYANNLNEFKQQFPHFLSLYL